MFFSRFPSPWGFVTVCTDGQYITNLLLDGTIPDGIEAPTLPLLEKTGKWLKDYFDGNNPSVESIPLSPAGTVFQQQVWLLLRKIPYGESDTYGQIAKKIATQMGVEKMSAQAVGNAVGRNPIPILIPCHRVLGSQNTLTGFSGGLDKKITLLKLEHTYYKP